MSTSSTTGTTGAVLGSSHSYSSSSSLSLSSSSSSSSPSTVNNTNNKNNNNNNNNLNNNNNNNNNLNNNTDNNLQKIWRPIWVPDHQEECCLNCQSQFNTLLRRHHCRGCGNLFCNNCTSKRQSLPQLHYNKPVRICNRCSDLTTYSKLAQSNEIKNKIEAAKGFCNLSTDSLARKMIIRGFLTPLSSLFYNGNSIVYKHLTRAIANLSECDISRIDILEANFLNLLVNYLLDSFKNQYNNNSSSNVDQNNFENKSRDSNNNFNNKNVNNNNNKNRGGKSGRGEKEEREGEEEEEYNDQQLIIHDEDFESFLNVCICFQYLSCEENIVVKTELADKCLPILIKMSRSYNIQIKNSSSIVLLNLTKNPLSRDQVVQGGGLQSFIAIALQDDVFLQETSSQALSILAFHQKYQRKVVECGALPPLVLMLNSSSEKVLLHTTATLSFLAENIENQIAIIKVGGINPLKNIITDKNDHCIQIAINAAITLSLLSTNKKLLPQLAQQDLVELLTKIVIVNYNNPSYELLLLAVKILGNLSFEKEVKNLIRRNQSMMNILRIMVHSTNRIQSLVSIIFNNCETGQQSQ
ncbi:hypothetical protein ACTFIT_008669 [Dictyostelium discoideum]